MKEFGVSHITSFPHYPQSNGLAEKSVQIVKNLFHKAKEEEKDMFKYLMIYCNTPLSSIFTISYANIIDLLDQTCQCPMWQGNSLVWTQKSLEAITRMNIYLCMTYTWVSMSCSKTQQAGSGSQLPLQAYVKNQ